MKGLKGFQPHVAKCTVSLEMPKPKILVSTTAHNKMYYWVQECKKEVGWFGTVRELPDNVFLIEDVYMFDQQVTAVETEINEDGLVEFANSIQEKYADEPEKFIDVMKKFRLWGHSHVNMGTTASSQDDKQIELFRPKGDNMDIEWFIRLICNKKGRMEWNIYHFKEGYIVEDVPWAVVHEINDDVADELTAELKEKVHETTYGGGSWGGKKYSGGYANWDIGYEDDLYYDGDRRWGYV